MKANVDKFIETLKREFGKGSLGVPNECRLSFAPCYGSERIFKKYWMINFHLRFQVPSIKRSVDFYLDPSYIDEESLMDL